MFGACCGAAGRTEKHLTRHGGVLLCKRLPIMTIKHSNAQPILFCCILVYNRYTACTSALKKQEFLP